MIYSPPTISRFGLNLLIVFALVSLGVPGLSAATDTAPQRIAVINLERAIYATTKAERRIAQLKRNEEYRTQRDEVESLSKTGQELVERLRRDESVLSETRKRELQRRITSVREDVEYAIKKLQTMEQAVVEEVREELADRAEAALEQLMEEEGVDILLRRHPNVPIILYADAKYDLTLKLTDLLNRTNHSPFGSPSSQVADDDDTTGDR